MLCFIPVLVIRVLRVGFNKCENYQPWCNKVSDALSDTDLQQFPHLFRYTNIVDLRIDMGINLLSYVTASDIATVRLFNTYFICPNINN